MSSGSWSGLNPHPVAWVSVELQTDRRGLQKPAPTVTAASCAEGPGNTPPGWRSSPRQNNPTPTPETWRRKRSWNRFPDIWLADNSDDVRTWGRLLVTGNLILNKFYFLFWWIWLRSIVAVLVLVPVWCWTWRRTSCGLKASRSSPGVDWTEISLQNLPPLSRSPAGGGGGRGEVRWPCRHHLDTRQRVYLYLNDRAGQDDVGAERTLRVEALLSAVIGLSQRHGQRRRGVHLQDALQLKLYSYWGCVFSPD